MCKFDPQKLDIWGQKSFFCFGTVIFVDRAHMVIYQQYTRGYNFSIGTTPKRVFGILKAYGPLVIKIAWDKEIVGFIISYLFPMQTTTDGSERASNFFLIPKVSNSGRPAKALEPVNTKVVFPPRFKAPLFSNLHLSQVFSIVWLSCLNVRRHQLLEKIVVFNTKFWLCLF